MMIMIAAFEVDKCFCDKYIPEFDDKQAFEISWLGPDTMVRIDKKNSVGARLESMRDLAYA